MFKNVCSRLAKEVYKNVCQFNYVVDLLDAIMAASNNNDLEYVRVLNRSIPSLLVFVVQSKGGMILY